MDEESGERRQIERAACAKLFGEWREDGCQWTDEVRGAVRERALRLDVQRTDDHLPDAQRNGELGEDPRQRRDEVRIHMHVCGELRPAEPHRASHDTPLDTQAIRDDRVSALRDEPETAMLEDEDGWKKACDGSMERLDGRGDGLCRLTDLGGHTRGPVRCNRQQPRVHGRRYASRGRRMLHPEEIGPSNVSLERLGAC